LFDDNIAPIPKPDVDFGSLSAQPTPEQYFLLSRINGELTVAELCRISGLDREQTLAELEQLVNYGLIEIPDVEQDVEDADEPREEEAEAAQGEVGEQGSFGAERAGYNADTPPPDPEDEAANDGATSDAEDVGDDQEDDDAGPEQAGFVLGAESSTPSEADDDELDDSDADDIASEQFDDYDEDEQLAFAKTAAAESTASGFSEVSDPSEEVAQAGIYESSVSESEDASDDAPAQEEAPDDESDAASGASDADKSRKASGDDASDSSESEKKKNRKSRRDVQPNFPVPPSEFEFDQALLDLDVPLDDEQRRQAICLYEQIDDMTFYDLFGVEQDASRRDIKKAYFRLSKRYHPDKFFRKELHDFSEILERVFQEITKAYRTLSKRDKREQYDQTIASASGGPSDARTQSGATTSEAAAFDDEASEKKKRKKNKKDAAALLLVRRAEKLVERGDYKRAASEYQKALALKREPSMAIEVARMLDTEGDQPEEAISFARAALKLDARNVEARVLLSDLYEKTGRHDDALKHLEKAARLDPSDEEIQEKLEQMRSGNQS
jgi:curved DNA-binding protein CbpA